GGGGAAGDRRGCGGGARRRWLAPAGTRLPVVRRGARPPVGVHVGAGAGGGADGAAHGRMLPSRRPPELLLPGRVADRRCGGRRLSGRRAFARGLPRAREIRTFRTVGAAHGPRPWMKGDEVSEEARMWR